MMTADLRDKDGEIALLKETDTNQTKRLEGNQTKRLESYSFAALPLLSFVLIGHDTISF